MAHMKHFEHLKISLDAIISATSNFAHDCCIGKGGFGNVYKAQIVHSERQMTVALKRLDRAFGQGDPEFWKEIIMLSIYKHENIVSLLGYCDDRDEKILVYEYVPNKSLDLYLNNHELTWVRRLHICIGAARGLAHLHGAVAGTQQRVLHRDIKSSNVLLDEDWNAKISDFGLSKFGPANQQITFLVSSPAGTLGYLDPLYIETGSLTKESDVYSFGVVLFEVLCGRLCMGNNERPPLIGLARRCYEENTLKEIVYEGIRDEIDADSLRAFTEIAFRCLKRDREERPLMTEVVKELESALEHQVLVRALKPTVGILNVKILRAMNLKSKNRPLDILSGPYAEVRLTGDDFQFKRTAVKRKTLSPKWYEEFNLDVTHPNVQALQVLVYGQKWRGKDMVGMNEVALKDLRPQVPKLLTLDLLMDMDHQNNEEEPQGQIVIEVTYKPCTKDIIMDASTSREGGGMFSVQILDWENVPVHLAAKTYIRLHFEGEIKRHKPRRFDDRYRRQAVYTYRLEKRPTNERLHVELVTDPDLLTRLIFPQECLGYVDIDIVDVVNSKQINQIYPLLDSKYKAWIHLDLEWKTFEEIGRQ